MLKEKTLFETIDRVKTAIKALKEFEPEEGYYVAFSGGKDSVVIQRLVEMAKVKHDTHYNVTTIDPPDIVYFIRKEYPNVIFDKPDQPFLVRLVKRGSRQGRHGGVVRSIRNMVARAGLL